MSRFSSHPARSLAGLAAGLALLAPRPGQASPPTSYKSQVIAHTGDTVGTVKTSASGHLNVGSLNDRGQLVFAMTLGSGEVLVEYTDGQLKPIVVPGEASPGGTWPKDAGIDDPACINQNGDIVFGVHENSTAAPNLGTYRWDAQTQKLSVVADQGLPAVNNLTFEAGSYWFPTINLQGEIAFPAWVKNVNGAKHIGVFFRSPDGQLQPIALPGDTLPGGKLVDAWPAIINDAGAVAITAQTGKGWGAYLWEKGSVSAVALPGDKTPDGGKITAVDFAWVNSKNSSVLIAAEMSSQPSGFGSLYLWTNGVLTPVATYGKDMPGGGQFKGVPPATGVVSLANGLGQHAFIAQLKDNTAAAYLMDADGTLSLIAKPGMTLDLGTITQVGEGSSPSAIAVNSSGQVAVNLRVTGQPRALVLLTPATP